MIHTCKCGHRSNVVFFDLTTPKKQRKGFFQSTQQLIRPKPYGFFRGIAWDIMSWISFYNGYVHKEPVQSVELTVTTYHDKRLETIKRYNFNVVPRQLQQLARCYVGSLIQGWSKANTKQFTTIGGTEHDKIKDEFLEAALLRCTRGEARSCTEYELTNEGKEFLRRFL